MKKKTISKKKLWEVMCVYHDKYFEIANGDNDSSEIQKIMACGAMGMLDELANGSDIF